MSGLSDNTLVIESLKEQNKLLADLSDKVGDIVARVAVLEDARATAAVEAGRRHTLWGAVVGAVVATAAQHVPQLFPALSQRLLRSSECDDFGQDFVQSEIKEFFSWLWRPKPATAVEFQERMSAEWTHLYLPSVNVS